MINCKKMVIVVKIKEGKIQYLGADYVSIEDITKLNVEVIEYKEVD